MLHSTLFASVHINCGTLDPCFPALRGHREALGRSRGFSWMPMLSYDVAPRVRKAPMANPTIEDFRKAPRRMALGRAPATEAAQRLVEAVVDEIAPYVAPKRQQGSTTRAIGPGKRATLVANTGRILGGILRDHPVTSAQRNKAAWQWSDALKYDAFWTTTDAMIAAGLVGFAKGGVGSKAGDGVRKGNPSRLWPCDCLEAMAVEHGVRMEAIEQHWKIPEAGRTTQAYVDAAHVIQGIKSGNRDWTPPPSTPEQKRLNDAMREQVVALNDHVRSATFEGQFVFPVFARKFSRDMRLGGRIYAIGGRDTYQTIKRRDRAAMRINDERVIEVDVKASQFSILLRLLDAGLVVPEDPYALTGLDRAVVKVFCVQSFGSGHLMTRWGDNTEAHIRKAVKASAVRHALLARYECLADFTSILPADLRRHPPPKGVAWAAGQHLVYLESIAIAAALQEVMDQGVVALPLHDALLVPESRVEMAATALDRAYQTHLDLVPRIKPKPFEEAAEAMVGREGDDDQA